jgi:hypothetical protein
MAATKQTVRPLTEMEDHRLRGMQWYLLEATHQVNQLRDVVEMLSESEARTLMDRVGVQIVTLGGQVSRAFSAAGGRTWTLEEVRPGQRRRRRQPGKRLVGRVLKLAGKDRKS